MEFTFRPTEIKCNQTLSSDDSPWGDEDGLRFYFMVEVGFQPPEFMVSDRTYPPPDVVENHPIKNGETLVLSSFPPQGRANWESRVFNIDEGDLVTIGLIGMNEGLPYIAGGGGSGEDDTLGRAFATGIKVFVGAVDVPVVSSLIEEGIDLAKDLSTFPDCSGTVFIYKRQFTGSQLIGELLKSRKRLNLHFSKNQSLRTQSAAGDCHVPNYEAGLEIRLKSPIAITESDRVLKSYNGESEPFVPKFTFCAEGNVPIRVWSVNHDREITFDLNFTLRTLEFYWEVFGQKITNATGDITRQINVRKQPNNKSVLEDVTVKYNVDFDKTLKITTQGSDGVYHLPVEAFVSPSSSEPPVKVYSTTYPIDGQRMDGDENYHAYQRCVNRIWRKIRSYVLVKQRLDPGEPNIYPADRFRDLERRLESLIEVVRQIRG